MQQHQDQKIKQGVTENASQSENLKAETQLYPSTGGAPVTKLDYAAAQKHSVDLDLAARRELRRTVHCLMACKNILIERAVEYARLTYDDEVMAWRPDSGGWYYLPHVAVGGINASVVRGVANQLRALHPEELTATMCLAMLRAAAVLGGAPGDEARPWAVLKTKFASLNVPTGRTLADDIRIAGAMKANLAAVYNDPFPVLVKRERPNSAEERSFDGGLSKKGDGPTSTPPKTAAKLAKANVAQAAPKPKVAQAVRVAPAATRAISSALDSEGSDYGGGFRHGTAKLTGRKTRTINGKRVAVDCWEGMERVDTIEAVSTTPLGATLAAVRLNPQAFGSRLPFIAQNYSNFEFKKVKAKTRSAVSGFADCGLLYMGYQADSEAPLPSGGDQALDDMSTWLIDRQYSITIESVNKNMELDCKLVEATNELFVDNQGDERWSDQGVVVVLNGGVTNLTASAPITVAHMFIQYTIELYNVNTNQQLATGVEGIGETNAAIVTTGGAIEQLTGNAVIPGPTGTPTALLSSFAGDTDVFTPVDFSQTGGNMLLQPGSYRIDVTAMAGGVTEPQIDPNGKVLGLVSGQVQLFTPPTGLLSPLTTVNTTIGDYVSLTGPLKPNTAFTQYWNGSPAIIPSARWPAGVYTQHHLVFFLKVISDSILLLKTPRWVSAGVTRVFLGLALSVSRLGQNDIVPRPNPAAVVAGEVVLNPRAQLAVARAMRAATKDVITDEIRVALMRGIALCDTEEASYCNVLIKAFDLPMAPMRVGPTAMHPGLSILLWLVKRFGPMLAAKALGVVQSTLERWIAEEEKKKE